MILRKATVSDQAGIWTILQQAIEQRRKDGSRQWQDGYPNEQSVAQDIERGYGYVLSVADELVAYAAVIFDIEPAYEIINGQWLTSGPYVVLHRVATSDAVRGKGMATHLFLLVEQLASDRGVYSIKVDTNFDNGPMLHILGKLGYTYCGDVFVNGASRRAYEKILTPLPESRTS